MFPPISGDSNRTTFCSEAETQNNKSELTVFIQEVVLDVLLEESLDGPGDVLLLLQDVLVKLCVVPLGDRCEVTHTRTHTHGAQIRVHNYPRHKPDENRHRSDFAQELKSFSLVGLV